MLDQQIKTVEPQVIEWRRTMHKHPELSYQEHWTSDYIEQALKNMDGIEVSRPTETSVLGIIKGEQPGRKVGLRADIDALPIQEDRDDLDFTSEIDGKMHACGHDAHAAMLLGAAKVLSNNKDKIHGEVYLIFQHAEETPPGGAREMVATGQFDDLDVVFAQHIMTTLPVGEIHIKSGPVTANSDIFNLTITGKGGHSSQPENSVDPVLIGSRIVSQVQDIVSRLASPLDNLVVSVTNFHAGTGAENVIPQTATISGSVRSASAEMRKLAKEKIEVIIKSNCDIYGAAYDLDYQYGVTAVINDEAETTKVRETLTETFGADRVKEMIMMMGGEDFGAFTENLPGVYIMIGTYNEKKDCIYPHHHPKFKIDEDVLIDGVRTHVNVILDLGRSG
ncbi:M20 metallopeptidase family protein [Lacicoccus alkaliphilus]|uniref:Amidohydrolase n=1 Tax=Lacicoccus alkaliphilus DSM 16010 TaxID=1123231 RepID=A0A1M7JXG8_9BACL|nr:amidohydrolase [Salinicoccus alkaliphilus]SHM57601.1 amidohydrolase [Salinicoccus alkaliphilus DSM 16010]